MRHANSNDPAFSAMAAAKMEPLGFPNLFDFHEGFTAWENAH
jgi:hypothetical protein